MDVTAAIIMKEGQVLIARRAPGRSLAGKWEFPGGKVESGESLAACLKREIREELGIEINVGERFCESTDESGRIRLISFLAEWVAGEITPTAHSQICWADPMELSRYDFASADLPIVKKLQEERQLSVKLL